MSKYKIEIRHLGIVVREFFTDDLEKAKKIYQRFTVKDNCSTELYIDGRRLRYIDAWELMEVKLDYLDFRSEAVRQREGKGCGIWD